MEADVGFRKRFMKWTNILGALVFFSSILYHVISGDRGHMLDGSEISALLMVMGIGTAAYTAARMGPGSLEYTQPQHIGLDPTCTPKIGGQGFTPPVESGLPVKPDGENKK